ncbi:MAG: tRNA lysidine(34) synthetase TilS [Pirellulales bacterium]|nr:tRNA lysidine(34) synthetase TilS [Pirellulales bacterium]
MLDNSVPSLPAFEEQIANCWPPEEWTGIGVLVAVSGGGDSVALLRSLHHLKSIHGGSGELIAAHFNHNLRPRASDDEAWVKSLCDRLHIPLVAGHGDVTALAAEIGDGMEAAARQARLAFLASTAEQRGDRFVATAHTADDQVETILFRILRGTGIAGLAGIRRVRPLRPAVTLIRPMLALSRESAEAYLRQIQQDWCDDETNSSFSHARNRIRHELLPYIRRHFNHQVDNAVTRLAKQAEALHNRLQERVDGLVAECLRIQGLDHADPHGSATGIEMDIVPLAQEPDIILAEVFRTGWRRAGWAEQAMTESHWQRLVNLLRDVPVSGRQAFPGGIVARRAGSQIHFTTMS